MADASCPSLELVNCMRKRTLYQLYSHVVEGDQSGMRLLNFNPARAIGDWPLRVGHSLLKSGSIHERIRGVIRTTGATTMPAIFTKARSVISVIRSLPRSKWFLIAGIAGLAALVLILTQCARSIESQIEKNWPSQDLSSVRSLVAKETSSRLHELSGRPALMVFISKGDVIANVNKNIDVLEGVSNVNLQFFPGYVLTSADFDLKTDKSAPKEAQDFTINGKVDAALAPFVDKNNILQFRVILVKLQNITINGKTGERIPKPVKDYLAKFVSSRLDSINGVFNKECARREGGKIIRVPSCFLEIPTAFPVGVDVVKSLQEQPQTEVATGNAVVMPIQLDKAVAYISPLGIYVSADAHLSDDPTWKPGAPTGNVDQKSSDELANVFDDQFSTRLGKDYRESRMTAALDTGLVARAFSSVATKTNLHLIQDFSSAPEKFDTEVRLAKKPTFSCDRSSCERKECRAPRCQYKDDRICHGDIGNFFCRTVQNTVCEPANAAGGLVCNIVREADAGTCNIFEEIKKGGCEANKIFVEKALGRIGRVGGDYSVFGNYDIHLLSASATDDLRQISMTSVAGANARAHGSLKFQPLDQGYVLACVSKWSEGFDVSVNIPSAEQNLTARFIESQASDEGISLKYRVDKFALEGRVSPSPFDAVFTQHPYLRINCSIAAGVGELARLVHLIDPENSIVPDELNEAVTGKVRKEVDDAEFEIKIPNLNQIWAGEEISLVPNLRPTAVIFARR